MDAKPSPLPEPGFAAQFCSLKDAAVAFESFTEPARFGLHIGDAFACAAAAKGPLEVLEMVMRRGKVFAGDIDVHEAVVGHEIASSAGKRKKAGAR